MQAHAELTIDEFSGQHKKELLRAKADPLQEQWNPLVADNLGVNEAIHWHYWLDPFAADE